MRRSGSRPRPAGLFLGVVAVSVVFSIAGAFSVLAVVLSITVPIKAADASQSTLPQEATPIRPHDSLITEPDAGTGPLDALLGSAQRSVDISMYELADPKAESILAADASRGVRVRMVLDQHQERAHNQAAFGYLTARGVAVHWAPAADNTFHIKCICVDATRCAVMTLNLVSRYYATTRDFAVVDSDPADVTAIEQTFAGDFAGHPAVPPPATDLVWSPGSTAALADLIAGANRTLLVYNEELRDPTTVDALASAARRGVRVELVMTYQPFWVQNFGALATAGARVHVLYGEHPVYVHAKMIWVDGQRVFLGSENLSTASLVWNRELGLISTDPAIVRATEQTFEHDAAEAPIWPVRHGPRGTRTPGSTRSVAGA
ncbi:MAG TPA: phospholipase D-like domain-containing protein [Acidimicrobiales bacterium]